jgi:hypothetical protein
MAREEAGLLGSIGEFLWDAGKEIINDPAIHAYGRLGIKELGNAFNLGHEGSISQSAHEYGMPFSGATPGEIAGQKEGNVYGSGGFEQEGAGRGSAENDMMAEVQAAGKEAMQGMEQQEQSRGR